jgi:diaminopimelate decarboxylase
MTTSIYIPDHKFAESIVNEYGTPVFVTDVGILKNRTKLFRDAFGKGSKIFYALKANYNPNILRVLKEMGIDGVDAVSPYEIQLAKQVGFSSNQIIFTGNNSDDAELKVVRDENVLLNIGSLSELERFGVLFPGTDISLRFNPGVGEGECHQVITGGMKSKFGILYQDIEQAKEIVNKHNLNIVGVHCHIGSGFYYTEKFQEAVHMIIDLATHFKNLKFIDIGGGFGVRYKPSESAINLKDFYHSIKNKLNKFNKKNGKEIDLFVEPGKFLVAESTCLLTRVSNIKRNNDTIFVGTDTGLNHLIRPSFYAAYHHIVNLSRPKAPLHEVQIVGNICESSDILGNNIEIAMPEEGDILAILTAGAYCASMSSLYNFRPYAAEVLVDGDKHKLIRKRLDFNQTLNGLGFL